MEQAILSKKQKKVIEAVSKEPNLADFYLSGGTALAAFYFHHRFSDDLDFFSKTDPDRIFLHDFTLKLKNILGAKKVGFDRLPGNIFF